MILNEDIRAREVRLIGVDGQQVGVVSKNEALRKAADADSLYISGRCTK